MRIRSRQVFPMLALTLILLSGVDVRACPNCKEAVAEQENSGELKNGYYYSILFMIGMPATLLSVGVFTVVRAAKNGLLPEM
jgi:hypothetical protein